MTEKSWHKIIVHCHASIDETVASFITGQTGNGVEIIADVNAPAYSIVFGYMSTDDPSVPDRLAAIRNYLHELVQAFPEYEEATLKLDSLADEDWQRKWKESFKSFHLSTNMVIKPSWETYQAGPGEKVIEIDPGLAFGTGLHASTRLAMELMEEHLGELASPPEEVLDVGTGTGILAIGSALLGCGKITATDNDAEAVRAATTNIEANNLTAIIKTSDAALAELTGPYDLILANIIHNTLVAMAPSLSGLLAPGGLLIMAGILKGGQTENITEKYCRQGLLRQKVKSSGEWSALSFKKPLANAPL